MRRGLQAVHQPRVAEHPRIVHVVFHLDVGGVETGVVNLARGLAKRGYPQAVCCLERGGALSGRVPPAIPVWNCGTEWCRRWLPLLRVARRLRRFRPDIVHARNAGAWRNAGAAWLLAGCPGRLVFTIHGPGEDSCGWRFRLCHRFLSLFTTRLAAVSDATAQEFAGKAGIPLDRFEILHSGVDTNMFRPRRTRHGNLCKALVLGCVARMDGLKGHDTLLAAFASLHERSPVSLKLHLIGDGVRRAALERWAQALAIGDSVRFLGECADVQRHMRHFDMFVLASPREGRPTSIMEALATGIPVVATRVGAVGELLDEGRLGLLIEPNDPEAIANAVLSLVRDATRRQQLGSAAREHAVLHLSLESMVQRYEAFYAGVTRR